MLQFQGKIKFTFWWENGDHFRFRFRKLDHFISIINICCIDMKRYSLHESLSKLMPKRFYEIDPRDRIHNTLYYCNL
jgi:hypothetical protein